MKRNVGKLIKVKSIVTLMLVAVFCTQVIRQNTEIPTETVVAIITAATTSLFVRSAHKDGTNGGEE